MFVLEFASAVVVTVSVVALVCFFVADLLAVGVSLPSLVDFLHLGSKWLERTVGSFTRTRIPGILALESSPSAVLPSGLTAST